MRVQLVRSAQCSFGPECSMTVAEYGRKARPAHFSPPGPFGKRRLYCYNTHAHISTSISHLPTTSAMASSEGLKKMVDGVAE